MDGLECIEVYFSTLKDDNEKYRMDNEFYLKKYIKSYVKIKQVPHTQISNVYSCLTDFHANGSYENISKNFELLDYKDYAYMVRTTDLEAKNYTDGVKYVSEHTYNYLSKSKVYGGEIIINKIGSPGRTFLMPNLNLPVSLGMNLFMLRLKKNCEINEPTLWAFLNTDLGRNIIKRKINGTVPLTIDKNAIKSLYIPVFQNIFQTKIKAIVQNSFLAEADGKMKYMEAEQLLLLELGLSNFAPSSKADAIKSFSESFLVSGRLDAEYYQPKYDKLLETIKHFDNKPLGELVTTKKSIEPGSDCYGDEGIPFVRVSDITKYGISAPEIKLPANVVVDVKSLYPKKDTILLSKDGSVGIAYRVEQNLEVITSGALLHLDVIDKSYILPDYLTLTLNSIVVQLQAERDASGAIIKHWKPSEIDKVIIPILDKSIQQAISKKIQQYFALRRQSEQLLENAKQAVEMAIEQGEDKAIMWLNEKGVED